MPREPIWNHTDHGRDKLWIRRLDKECFFQPDACLAAVSAAGVVHLTREALADLVRAAAPLAGLTVVDHPVPAVPPPPTGIHPRPYGDHLRLIATSDLVDLHEAETNLYGIHTDAGAITPHDLPSRNQHYARANAHRQRLEAVVAELARRAAEADTVPRTPIAQPPPDSAEYRAVAAQAVWSGRRRGEDGPELMTMTEAIAQYIATGRWSA